MGPVCLDAPSVGTAVCRQACMLVYVFGTCLYANGLQHLVYTLMCRPDWVVLGGMSLCEDVKGMQMGRAEESPQKAHAKGPGHTSISGKLLRLEPQGMEGQESPGLLSSNLARGLGGTSRNQCLSLPSICAKDFPS